MQMTLPHSSPAHESVIRLGVARERLRALCPEVERIRARTRTLAAATDWQSRALGPFRKAMSELIDRFDRLTEGMEIADIDLRAEQDRMRAIRDAGL